MSVWCEVKDDIIVGEIVYTQSTAKTLIRLLGEVWKDGRLNIHEMLPDGRITGTIRGEIKGGGFAGKWLAPERINKNQYGEFISQEGQEYSINLNPAAQARQPFHWRTDYDEIPGTYAYSYGENRANGTVTISKTTTGNLSYSIEAITDAPVYRTASIFGHETSEPQQRENLEHHLILHEEGDDCAFTMYFANGFLVIRYVEQRYCREMFGMGATVEGVFLKQPTQKLE